MNEGPGPYSRSEFWIQVGDTGRIRVPYRSAGEWLHLLGAGPLDWLVLRAADSPELTEKVVEGAVHMDQIRDASTSLLGHLTGYGPRWWVGYNLACQSYGRAGMGAMALEGGDPHAMRLERWCAAVHAPFTRNAKPEDVIKFDALMDVPPPGYEPGDAWDDGYDPRVAAQS